MTHPKSGAAFAVATLGIALFTIMDAFMKGLSLEAGAYNAVLWRMIAGVVLAGIPFLLSRDRWPPRDVLKLHVHRGIVGAITALLFFWGLARVPMAQAVALAFIAPLVTLYMAAVLLGERIDRRAIIASAVCFAGVLTILAGQARAELGEAALAGSAAILVSAITYSYNLILMRRQSQVAGGVEVSFFHSVVVAGSLLLGAPLFATVPGAGQLPDIIAAAILGTLSIYLLSWAYARAEASYLAPVEYTAFIWAIILGFLVFDERVGLLTVAGAIMIAGACLVAARRKPVPLANLDTAV